MVHIAAIRTALERNETDAIERAFRVLAEYPRDGLVEGVDSAEVLTETLDRVVVALSNDSAIMPSRTFDAIVRAKPNALVLGASYAMGASVVAAHRKHWHAMFLVHVAHDPGGGAIERGRDTGPATSMTVELPPTLARGLDAYISAQPEARLSRPEAARVILRHALSKLGYL